ncbi:MAG: GNAT family N-acetyltransferase [Bacteroidales bacterium]|nr:GNAT family N-acetyltransferase [Bacteroidales bacterium]
MLEIKEFHTPFEDLLQIFSNRSLLHYTDLDYCTAITDMSLVAWVTDADRMSFAGYENGQFAGFVSAHLVRKHLTASITIVVLEKFQHKGFAKFLLSHIAKILQETGMVRIEAQICTENIASVGLFEQSGFEREGVLHKNFLIDGVLRDSYMYAAFN